MFHNGHRALLMKAFEVGNHVLIGVSSDEMVKTLRKPHTIASYAKRLEEVKNFLLKNNIYDMHVVIIKSFLFFSIVLIRQQIAR